MTKEAEDILYEYIGCKELNKKLNIVKKNREALSEEDLKGKYRKAYISIKNEIKILLERFIKYYIAERYVENTARENREKIINFANNYLFKEIDYKDLWQKCWKELNINEVIKILDKEQLKMQEFYYSNGLCWISSIETEEKGEKKD